MLDEFFKIELEDILSLDENSQLVLSDYVKDETFKILLEMGKSLEDFCRISPRTHLEACYEMNYDKLEKFFIMRHPLEYIKLKGKFYSELPF